METSIQDLIQQWYAEYSKDLSSGKGTTCVVPIKGMEDSLIMLFHAIKEIGYAEEDFNRRCYDDVLKCCIPNNKKGKDRKGWEHNIQIKIVRAKAAVYGSALKALTEKVTDETVARYADAYKNLESTKKYSKTEKKEKEADTIEEEPLSEMEDGDDFEESKDFKPLDRKKLKESPPETIEDDSWLHEVAESYDE